MDLSELYHSGRGAGNGGFRDVADRTDLLFTESIADAFNTRELLKIAVLKNCADDPRAIAEMIAGRTHSQVVQVIGKKIILYKPDKKNPKIILPKA